MASKRNLKKRIHNVCEMLMIEVVLQVVPQQKEDQLQSLLSQINHLECETIQRVNSLEKLKAKAHFTKLKKDFLTQVQAEI